MTTTRMTDALDEMAWVAVDQSRAARVGLRMERLGDVGGRRVSPLISMTLCSRVHRLTLVDTDLAGA